MSGAALLFGEEQPTKHQATHGAIELGRDSMQQRSMEVGSMGEVKGRKRGTHQHQAVHVCT